MFPFTQHEVERNGDTGRDVSRSSRPDSHGRGLLPALRTGSGDDTDLFSALAAWLQCHF